MDIMTFGHKNFITWTEAELRAEREADEKDNWKVRDIYGNEIFEEVEDENERDKV